MAHNNENTNAFLTHISSFAGYLFPLGGIITPLILWQTLKNRSPFLDSHGKEAVNFNISYSLYVFVLVIFAIPFGVSTFFDVFNGIDISINENTNFSNFFGYLGITLCIALIMIFRFVLIIIAAIKANMGESFQYPFTIKFIK